MDLPHPLVEIPLPAQERVDLERGDSGVVVEVALVDLERLFVVLDHPDPVAPPRRQPLDRVHIEEEEAAGPQRAGDRPEGPPEVLVGRQEVEAVIEAGRGVDGRGEREVAHVLLEEGHRDLLLLRAAPRDREHLGGLVHRGDPQPALGHGEGELPGAARHVDQGARGGPLAVEHVHDPGNELQAPAALTGFDVRLGVAAVDAHRPMVEGVLPLRGVLLCQEIARTMSYRLRQADPGGARMIVHYLFQIHPDHKDRAKDELRKLKTVVQKHGGRNFKYYASMTSGTPNRLFMYEIDKLAHFDTLSTDPDFRAVKLDSLYTDATGTTWAEVPL